MATLLEMAKDIVMAHASTTSLSKDELLSELREVYNSLSALEKGEAPVTGQTAVEETVPAISKRKAFGKSKITCMLCGAVMKTLARHLRTAHQISPKQYRDQFDIPRTQPLAAKDYSESRRQMAIEKDLGAGLAKARAAKGKGKAAGARKRAPRKTESVPAAE